MFRKKSKKMFIAVDQIRVVCPRAQLYVTWCAGCRQNVELVTFAEAANIACTNVDAVIEQAAAGKIHLGIRPEAMLVCLNSLLSVNRKINSVKAAQTQERQQDSLSHLRAEKLILSTNGNQKEDYQKR